MLIAVTILAFLGIVGAGVLVARGPAWVRWSVGPLALAGAAAVVGWLAVEGEKDELFDPVTLLAVLCAGAATAAGILLGFRGRRRAGLALLLAAAFLLRGNMAARCWLAAWDERYHALVARNLMRHPLKPTLEEEPISDRPPTSGYEGHVWLHKPPLALWLMAGSMALLGPNEIASRVPAVAAGTLSVLVAFWLTRRFAGPRAGFLAAAFCAWHGYSAELAGGLKPTDSVDVLFTFWVGLGVCAAARAADALGERRKGGWGLSALTGIAFGLGMLTKEAPALVVPAVFFFLLCATRARWPSRLGAPAVAAVIGLALWAPWQLYTRSAFPQEYAYKATIAARRFVEAMEGHEGPWTFYLDELPELFGDLVYLPAGAFLLWSVWRRREFLPLVGWFVLTYGAFSAAATKMPAYVLIASPVLWCAFGWFLDGCFFQPRKFWLPARVGLWVLGAGVAVVYLGTASMRHYEIRRPLPRAPVWARELRYLRDEVGKLPAGKWVVFHVTSPTEAMFTTGVTCLRPRPKPETLDHAKKRGFGVAFYGTAEDLPADCRGREDEFRFIPYAPLATGMRSLARELKKRKLRHIVLYCRRARDVEEYLLRSGIDVKARTGMPPCDRDHWLRRRLRRGRAMVVLARPDTRDLSERRERYPKAVWLFGNEYAND
jgi:4-amino-4-deoxy-L-arabinose transferase